MKFKKIYLNFINIPFSSKKKLFFIFFYFNFYHFFFFFFKKKKKKIYFIKILLDIIIKIFKNKLKKNETKKF
jgi:hypothetical protein